MFQSSFYDIRECHKFICKYVNVTLVFFVPVISLYTRSWSLPSLVRWLVVHVFPIRVRRWYSACYWSLSVKGSFVTTVVGSPRWKYNTYFPVKDREFCITNGYYFWLHQRHLKCVYVRVSLWKLVLIQCQLGRRANTWLVYSPSL
jgi:hypothetical protein